MAPKKRKSPKPFPKEILVSRETDTEGGYLLAHESLGELDRDQEGRRIARYQLVDSGEFEIARTLKFDKR